MKISDKNMVGKIIYLLFNLILLFSFPFKLFAGQHKDNSIITLGEKLFYDVKFLGIKGVDVTFEVKGLKNIAGRGAVKNFATYHIVVTAKTNDFFTKYVYKVDNLYDVFIDTTTFQPRLFQKAIRQGKDDNYDSQVYTWLEKNAAYYDDNFALKIPENTFEIFSAIYLLRQKAEDLAPGDTLKLNALSDKILWDMLIIAIKRENIEVNDKDYDTTKYKFVFYTDSSKAKLKARPPDLFLKNIFDVEGEAYLWLSEDENHYPVKADFKRSAYHLVLLLKKSSNTE